MIGVEATKTTATWWTIPEAARFLGIGRAAVLTAIDQGRLTARKLPGSYVRVLAADVAALSEECTSGRVSR